MSKISTGIQFEKELASLLNRYCAENGSNTPDYILAEYLMKCMAAFDYTSNRREEWYGRSTPRMGSVDE